MWGDEDPITVVGHIPYYPGECDFFDLQVLAARRARYGANEYEALTGIPMRMVMRLNPMNVFPVHDLPRRLNECL